METWVLAENNDGDVEIFSFDEKEFQPQVGEIIPEELIGDEDWEVIKIYNGDIAKKLDALKNLWVAIKGCADGFFDLISVIIRDAKKGRSGREEIKKGEVFYNSSLILQEKILKF